MLSLLRLECKQKNYSNPSRIRIFLFLSYSFGIETVNTFIHYVVPLKPYPISDQNGQSLDSFSDQNGAKTLPNGAAHTSVYGLYKGVPPPPSPRAWKTNPKSKRHIKKLIWLCCVILRYPSCFDLMTWRRDSACFSRESRRSRSELRTLGYLIPLQWWMIACNINQREGNREQENSPSPLAVI